MCVHSMSLCQLYTREEDGSVSIFSMIHLFDFFSQKFATSHHFKCLKNASEGRPRSFISLLF